MKPKINTMVEHLLRKGLSDFYLKATELEINDNCLVQTHFFIQGIRDSLETDDEAYKWSEEELKTQLEAMFKTFNQYGEPELVKIKERYWRQAKKTFPDLKDKWAFPWFRKLYCKRE